MSEGSGPETRGCLDERLAELGCDFELGLLERALRHEPENHLVLMALAELYTARGQLQRGLLMDRRLSELLPDDPYVRYNLACSLALTGDVPAALAALRAFGCA